MRSTYTIVNSCKRWHDYRPCTSRTGKNSGIFLRKDSIRPMSPGSTESKRLSRAARATRSHGEGEREGGRKGQMDYQHGACVPFFPWVE